MWPAVLASTQCLTRSLPSLGNEGEAGPDSVAATLRKVSAVDPSQYPDYEPPLMLAKERFSQRRRAEDAVNESQVKRGMRPDHVSERLRDAVALAALVGLWQSVLGTCFFPGGYRPMLIECVHTQSTTVRSEVWTRGKKCLDI